MLRVLKFMTIICVYSVLLPSMAAKTLSVNGLPLTQISVSDTTSSTNTKVTPSLTKDSSNEVIESESDENEQYYHPTEDKRPQVIEEFNHQYLDGSYEFKYILSNGVIRYEKSYWKQVGKGKQFLARKGFYSHPLKNHKYLTVFYTADEHGFQQETTKYSNSVPTLPKYLEVPQLEFPHETSTIIATTTTTSTTQKPKTTSKITTRKPRVTTTQRPVAKPSKFNWIY